MHPIEVLCIVASDERDQKPSFETHASLIEHQTIMMLKLIGKYPLEDAGQPSRFINISGSYDAIDWTEDPCTWDGVMCKDGIVDRIGWGERRIGQSTFDLQWLPNLTDFGGYNGRALTPLVTRLLPRTLILLIVKNCRLSGTLELRTLPPNLDVLDLQQNLLTGTVHLISLPETIFKIDLEHNQFSSLVVQNSALPEELVTFRMSYRKEKIRVSLLDGRRLDPRIHISHSFV